MPHQCVGRPCQHRGKKPGDSRHKRKVKTGFDDHDGSRESSRQKRPLQRGRFFLKKKHRKDSHEKRGDPVEHGGIGKRQVSYGIKVKDHGGKAEKSPGQQRRQVPPFAPDVSPSRFAGRDENDHHDHQIADKDFHEKRDVSGKFDTPPHEGKRGRREYHVEYSGSPVMLQCHSRCL